MEFSDLVFGPEVVVDCEVQPGSFLFARTVTVKQTGESIMTIGVFKDGVKNDIMMSPQNAQAFSLYLRTMAVDIDPENPEYQDRLFESLTQRLAEGGVEYE